MKAITYRPTPTLATLLVIVFAALAFGVLLTACGGGGDDDQSEVPPVTCRDQPRPPACL